MDDGMHRYGALPESYGLEYSVLEQADKNKNTNFGFDTYDTYEWYLNLGPLSNVYGKHLHGTIPFWNSIMEHPDYDSFWKKESWVNQLRASTVPNLNVAGFWDQEDPLGTRQIFRHAAEDDPDHTNYIVAGPWFHGAGQWPRESFGAVIRQKVHCGRLQSRHMDLKASLCALMAIDYGVAWRVKVRCYTIFTNAP